MVYKAEDGAESLVSASLYKDASPHLQLSSSSSGSWVVERVEFASLVKAAHQLCMSVTPLILSIS